MIAKRSGWPPTSTTGAATRRGQARRRSRGLVLRSGRGFLAERACPAELTALVLECIAHHHSGDPNRSFESILLSDADALDFLGTVGFARCFAMNSRHLGNGYEYVKKRRAVSEQVILLDKAKELARPLLAETDLLLGAFEQETFGLF